MPPDSKAIAIAADRVEILDPNRLPILAEEIKTAHANAVAAAKTTLTHAMEAGDRLIQAKAIVGHGNWLYWLAENCELKPRTAQNYMNLARNREALEAKSASLAHLSITAAMAEVAAPRSEDRKAPPPPDPMAHIPPPGHMAVGTCKNAVGETVFICESKKHPGYYFVAQMYAPIPDAGGFAAGTRRPVLAHWVMDALKDITKTECEWEHVEREPWEENYFLHGMSKQEMERQHREVMRRFGLIGDENNEDGATT